MLQIECDQLSSKNVNLTSRMKNVTNNLICGFSCKNSKLTARWSFTISPMWQFFSALVYNTCSLLHCHFSTVEIVLTGETNSPKTKDLLGISFQKEEINSPSKQRWNMNYCLNYLCKKHLAKQLSSFKGKKETFICCSYC